MPCEFGRQHKVLSAFAIVGTPSVSPGFSATLTRRPSNLLDGNCDENNEPMDDESSVRMARMGSAPAPTRTAGMTDSSAQARQEDQEHVQLVPKSARPWFDPGHDLSWIVSVV